MDIAKKIKRIARVIILLGVLLVLSGVFIVFNLRGCSFQIGMDGFVSETNEIETFSGDIHVLALDVDGAKIDVRTDETVPVLTVKYYDNAEDFTVEIKNIKDVYYGVFENRLSIMQTFNEKELKKGGNFEILLPVENTLNKISIVARATDIHLSDIQINEMRIEVNAGNIKLNDVKTEYLKVKNNAGNVKGDNVQTGKLEANVDAGNIKFDRLSGCKDVSGYASVGNVKLTVVGKKEDYQLTIRANGKGETENESAEYKIKAVSTIGKASVDFAD